MADCPRCGASWGGNRTAHCAACHATFSSDSGFDRHLISRKHAGCHDPATLRKPVEGGDPEPVFEWNDKRQMWQLASKAGAGYWGAPTPAEATT